ncbi:hypothetical protein B5P19_07795 [Clavibacter sepedonicus]|nr:hypothetical protein B5P19_07795 [Clavibacter sepedonicus]OQJ54562.1 hypothetical protein B5P20_10985 [Clavibacter sepedonicus]
MRAAAAATALAPGLLLPATGAAQADTRHAPTGTPARVPGERAAGDLTAQERRHARAGDGRDGGRDHEQHQPHQGRICVGCAG